MNKDMRRFSVIDLYDSSMQEMVPNYGVRVKYQKYDSNAAITRLSSEEMEERPSENNKKVMDPMNLNYSSKQLNDALEFGQSLNGYTSGGNFDDNPSVKNFTLRKYQLMQHKGMLNKSSVDMFNDSIHSDTMKESEF